MKSHIPLNHPNLSSTQHSRMKNSGRHLHGWWNQLIKAWSLEAKARHGKLHVLFSAPCQSGLSWLVDATASSYKVDRPARRTRTRIIIDRILMEYIQGIMEHVTGMLLCVCSFKYCWLWMIMIYHYRMFWSFIIVTVMISIVYMWGIVM